MHARVPRRCRCFFITLRWHIARCARVSPSLLFVRTRSMHPRDRRDSHSLHCSYGDVRDSRYPRRSVSIQSDATVESHWYSRSGIKVTKLEEPHSCVLFFPSPPFLHDTRSTSTYRTRMTHAVRFTRVPRTVLRHVEISLDIIRNFHKISLPNPFSRDALREMFLLLCLKTINLLISATMHR